jgi:hypothetical protein
MQTPAFLPVPLHDGPALLRAVGAQNAFSTQIIAQVEAFITG